MNVLLSLGSVPVKPIVCGPLVNISNETLNPVKSVLGGRTRAPTSAPSTVTLIGWR